VVAHTSFSFTVGYGIEQSESESSYILFRQLYNI